MKRTSHFLTRMLLVAVIVASFVLPTTANAYTYKNLLLVTPDYYREPANRVITTTSTLYVRNGPGTNYTTRGYIYGGNLVYVSWSNGRWGYVPAAGGYICLDYTKPATYLGTGPEIFKTYTRSGANVMLRKGPSTGFGIVKYVPSGAKIDVYYYSGNWSWVVYKQGRQTYRGWMSTSYIRLFANGVA